jgi:dTDP-glucose pyrophosphorylase
MKTLLLAAGGSAAFAAAGFHYPKNLVEVSGAPLLIHVIAALGPLGREGRLVVVARQDEALRYHTDRVVRLVEPTAAVVTVGETSGAACSALLACEHLIDDEPVLVVNGDQIVDHDLAAVVESFTARSLDAGVVVFDAVHPRWSYVRLEEGLVVEASEKRPISAHATAGVYWFARAGDFVAAAKAMIMKDAHVDGSFFVCPALNELVLAGARIGVHRIERNRYFSFHEPAGVAAYEHHLADRVVA